MRIRPFGIVRASVAELRSLFINGQGISSVLVNIRPLSVPVQTLSVCDAGTCLDVHPAKDLLDSSFNPIFR